MQFMPPNDNAAMIAHCLLNQMAKKSGKNGSDPFLPLCNTSH